MLNKYNSVYVEEVYAGTEQKRLLRIRLEQKKLILLNDFENYRVANIFKKIFLPEGYPANVSKDYLTYQIYDTLQAFCSTIAVIIATQEIMKSVGVGNKEATPLAATVTWVFRDGCGHIGKILFSYTHGTYLDAYSKKWRLYADILNDAALCIEVSLSLFGNFSIVALSLSSVFKALVGVAGGATRAAMTQHHAIRGNMADVASKDAAQETAVNLIASVVALVIITCIGHSSLIFILVLILHITFNYYAVRAVCLPTLNDTRFMHIIQEYLNDSKISSPEEVNKIEPLFLEKLSRNSLDETYTGFRIILGCSLKNMLNVNIEHVFFETYKAKKYIIMPDDHSRKAYVFFKSKATSLNILEAYFHCVILCMTIDVLNKGITPELCTRLPKRLIRLINNLMPDNRSFQVDYIPILNGFIDTEWSTLKRALGNKGWDLSKNLLISDNWRISKVRD